MQVKNQGVEFIQRRGKLIAPLVSGFIMFLLGALGTVALLHDTGTGIIWPLVALPGFVLIYGCYFVWYWIGQFLRPSRLQLLESGLFLKTFAKTSEWNWAHIANFRPGRAGIRFDVADPASGATKVAVLPGNWSVGLADVISALKAAQSQYAPDGAKRPPPGGTLSMADIKQLGVMMLFVGLLFIQMIVMAIYNDHQDKISEPFIRNASFMALPNCPTYIAIHDLIPVACDDPRYRIREGYSRYGLPTTKGHWLRVGRDAIGIGYCGPRACWVDKVIRNQFPIN